VATEERAAAGGVETIRRRRPERSAPGRELHEPVGSKPVTSTSYSLRPMKATVTSHLLPKAAATGRAGCGPDLDDVGVPCRLVRLLRCKREHLLDRPRDDGMRLDADQRLLHVGNRQRERRRTRDRSRKGTGTVPEREREGLRAGGGGYSIPTMIRSKSSQRCA